MDFEHDIIDLEPYRTGKKTMYMKCSTFSGGGCGKKIDITKEFIGMEEQNTIRKKWPDYRPGSDLLCLSPRLCEECKRK